MVAQFHDGGVAAASERDLHGGTLGGVAHDVADQVGEDLGEAVAVPGDDEGHRGRAPVGADEPDGARGVERLQVEDRVVS